MADAMIALRGLEKTYLMGGQPLRALAGLDLDISPGEYISVMGPSGSGKSTLLNMLGLLDRPDAGSYRLNGVATEQLPEEARAALRRDNIGFIFQAFHLIGRLSAFENVELPMVLAGLAPKVRREAVEGVLDLVGLLDRQHHRPGQLSGGQLQRVAIARAIVMKPRILLADEPTGNLDQASGRDIVNVLEDLNREGITLVVVTHDGNLGQRAGRRIRMVDGTVVEDARGAPG
ncbi:MAG: ABC transporter ATP-binding protein [Porticoccaceae bacterium]|jgi:putative ABC transport system ATP-binding protein|nr:ABC transporter ATP-binding protein [Porticoccaceae bacterium]HLS98143.1 ABC transporter ATP-binding protein [Porticoccaceae bacterium]